MKLNDLLQDTHVPNFTGANANLGGVLSGLIPVAFYLAIFLAFFWFVWGAMQYLFAGGDKQKLGEARGRMTAAIIGLIIVVLSFTITKYVYEILKPAGWTTIFGR